MFTLIKIDKTEVVEHTQVKLDALAEQWVKDNLSQDPTWIFTKEFVGDRMVYKLEKHHD
jgi:hypothetical protein